MPVNHMPRQIAAVEQDAAVRLWHDAWHETQAPYVPAKLMAFRTPADFRRRVIGFGDRARIIGPQGRPVGFCAIQGNQMDQLFVAPTSRGTGVAARLLADAERRLRKEGVEIARLDCLKDNAPAIRFYEKNGWTAQGLMPVALETSAGPFTLDCMVFQKRLR